ncbi:MAG: helix-turn-helix domain-containing protein, partial [Acidobacteriota bacterium]
MASFGETLRRERELREISLREISDATKISMRYLEALEQDRFDILPGGLFNKGFIRAYAAYIGVDGEAMVNCYLEQIAPPEAGADLDARSPMPDVHRPARTPRRR